MSADRLLQGVGEAARLRLIEGGSTRGTDPGLAFPITETDAAKLFVDGHRDDVLHCPGFGWFLWDGIRWQRDEFEVAITDLVTQSTYRLRAKANDMPPEEFKKAVSSVLALQKRHGILNVTELASKQVSVNVEQLDADPFLFGTKNCTIDLRSGEPIASAREHWITKASGIPYDPGALCPRFARFLEEVFAGDADLIAFVQRAVGYSLTASTREQCFFVLHGHGANGKSVFLRILQAICGEYGSSASMDSFLERRPGTISNDLAGLRGARCVSAVETGQGGRLAEGFIKTITGSDRVSARFLYREAFEFTPAFKLWLACNHRPVINGTDLGMWRRVRLIPFEQTFSGDRCDPDLEAKLMAELPGILAWAVMGCLAWQKSGLGTAKAVADATASYRTEMDTFGDFIAAKCVTAADASAPATTLFKTYRAWAEENGEKALSQRWFGQRLADRGFRKIRRMSGVEWQGIAPSMYLEGPG